MKTDGNRIRIEISPDIPFQILSFRINGKECDFYWQGKKASGGITEKKQKSLESRTHGFCEIREAVL